MSVVRPAYKQTEVGMIPEEWAVEPLGTLIGSLDAGVSVRSVPGDADNAPNDKLVLKTSCIGSGRFLPSEAKPILPADIARAKTPVRADTIVISRMNTPDLVGEVGYVDMDYLDLFLPDRLWIARAASGRKVSMRWLTAVLAHGDAGHALRETATGTSGSMKNISKPALRGVLVPTPSPDEQYAIAEALGDADALIEALEALIAKKRDIKQGAMQELLTGWRRLPGFQGEWKPLRIGDLATILRGASPRPIEDPIWFDVSSNVGWVRISDVSRSGMHLLETEQRLSSLGIERSRFVEKGNLIMSIAATIGRPVITGIDVCIHDGFVVFLGLKSDQSFMFYKLRSVEREWSSEGQTGSQMNLNSDLIARKLLLLPPTLDEQRAIAAVLSDMDAEIAALEDKLAKARAMKQGMMQVLLTGEIRLT